MISNSWSCRAFPPSCCDVICFEKFENKLCNQCFFQKMERNKCYRWCFVPKCKSTSVKNPEKIFLCVPKGEPRKKWYKTVRRDMCPTTSLTSTIYCCEDHFNVSIYFNFECRIMKHVYHCTYSNLLIKEGRPIDITSN